MISRKRLLAAAVTAVVAAASLVAIAATSSARPATRTTAAAAPRHNIVFVLTDDLSRNLVQYMPHVLGLERTGTSFTNYTVTDSLCCPSRSSIFSGRFPHDTHVFTNTAPDGGFPVFHGNGEEKSTFATDLQHAGYRTAMLGKYLNGYQADGALDGQQNYVPPGWDDWFVTDKGYSEYNYTINHNHVLEAHGHQPKDYLVDVMRGEADRFVTSSAKAHQPFMMEVATFAPHGPYTPAPRDVGTFPGLKAPRGPAFNRTPTPAPQWLKNFPKLTAAQIARIDQGFRKRVEAVQSVDRLIASVEQTLKAAGVAKNTDIVFSSDNGYHMGQYRLMPGKMTAFDTDVNVPLVAAGPDVAAGRTVAAPTENIDLRPTFDTIAHTSTSPVVDGHSLSTLLAGRRTAWRSASLIEHHGRDTDPSDPDHPALHSGNPPTYDAMRTMTYTYVEYANGQKELYNHMRDPRELHNVVGQAPAWLLARLHAQLHALTTCHGTVSCWAAGK